MERFALKPERQKVFGFAGLTGRSRNEWRVLRQKLQIEEVDAYDPVRVSEVKDATAIWVTEQTHLFGDEGDFVGVMDDHVNAIDLLYSMETTKTFNAVLWVASLNRCISVAKYN
jgi:hypothetical protein